MSSLALGLFGLTTQSLLKDGSFSPKEFGLSLILGLLLLLVVFARSIMHGKTKAGSESTGKSAELHRASASTARVATIDLARLQEPGFGYDNVRVSKLLVHPIKSCRGISLQAARYTPEGVEYDRLWSIVDAETRMVITAREVAKMVLITPEIRPDENSPFGGVLVVSFPEGSGCSSFEVPLRPSDEITMTWQSLDVNLWSSMVDSRICEATTSSGSASPSEILSLYFEKPVHLVLKGQRPRNCPSTTSFPNLKATSVYQDAYPLLFLSQESVDIIEGEIRGHVGKQGVDERWETDKLVIERFRPNVILSGGGPFAEDLWEEIQIEPAKHHSGGAQVFLIVSKCTRCLLPNVSPNSGIRDKAVPYKVLMKMRVGVDPANKWKPCVGCNGVPLGCGQISLGDKVIVKKLVSTITNVGRG